MDDAKFASELLRLVAEDRAMRERAGEAIQQAFREDAVAFEDDAERFSRRVATAVARLDDVSNFVRRLCAFKLALHRDWLGRVEVNVARWKERDKKYAGMADSIVEKFNATTEDATRDRAMRRFQRISAAYISGDPPSADDPYRGAETSAPSGFGAFLVLRALGHELLAAPEALEALLDDKQLRRDGLDALARAGVVGLEFASRLLSDLDALRPEGNDLFYFDAAPALGAIGREHAPTADALIERLGSHNAAIRHGAAASLEAMDGALAGRNAVVVERLLARPEALSISALASAGRDDSAVRARVAEQLRDRPPRMEKLDGWNAEYDATMYERGRAIEATRYLTAFPDEFVPLLIDALDTFEEYDPDECYAGPCGRVANALARFGAAAGPAALPLARKMFEDKDGDGEYARAIVSALVAIGPAARGALPLLDRYRRRSFEEDADIDPAGDAPIDKICDPVGHAMRQILRGSTGGEP